MPRGIYDRKKKPVEKPAPGKRGRRSRAELEQAVEVVIPSPANEPKMLSESDAPKFYAGIRNHPMAHEPEDGHRVTIKLGSAVVARADRVAAMLGASREEVISRLVATQLMEV